MISDSSEFSVSISGLVITLTDSPEADTARTALAHDPRLTLGEQFGRRLAAVADTPSPQADRLLWDDLRAMPGIVNVDVTYVHLDPSQPPSTGEHRPSDLENTHAHA